MKRIVVLNSFAHRDGTADFGAEGWQVTTLRAHPDPALDDAAALAALAEAEAAARRLGAGAESELGREIAALGAALDGAPASSA